MRRAFVVLVTAALLGASAHVPAAAIVDDEAVFKRALTDGDHTLSFNGVDRHYILRVPRVTTSRPPLLVVLHGAGGTAADMEKDTGFTQLLGDRAVILYPDGLYKTWNAGGCCLRAVAEKVDDVGFLSRLVEMIAGRGLAESKRVYLAGFSNGGMMAARMACETMGYFAGVAEVGSTLVSPCFGTSRMAVLLVHGTGDRMVPIAGYSGPFGGSKQTVRFPPLASVTTSWQRMLACPANPTASIVTATGRDERRWVCKDGELVVELLPGAGHAWPGNPRTPMPDARGFDATRAAAALFDLD